MNTPILVNDLDYGALKEFHTIQSYRRELEFTRIYQQHAGVHPYLREARCLEFQVPAMLQPIQEGDWFAGRLDRLAVGVDPERGDVVEAGFYIQAGQLRSQLAALPKNDPRRTDIQSLLDFWGKRQTSVACRAAFSPQVQQGIPSDLYYSDAELSHPFYGLGGPCLDFAKLVRLGIGGLRREVQARLQADGHDASISAFLEGLLIALETFATAARRYAEEARLKAASACDDAIQRRYRIIADSLEHIAEDAPVTYHQALQLIWLYAVIALVRNYGRLDVAVGDLLTADLAAGRLSRAEALEMTIGLWRLIVARGDNFNNRILVGGKGRPNPATADQFALLAMEAQVTVNEPIPQLSLRWHTGMNPALWTKALAVIGQGCTFPIIYNDDVNVPAVQKSFGVSAEEAEQYMMYGCGEFVLEHRSIGAPDSAVNIAKILEVTLRNGVDAFDRQRRGLALGGLADFATFEQLQSAFAQQMEHQAGLLAEAQDTIYRITGEQVAFPFLSLLYDDCIARGKPLLAGGVRYRQGITEAFGNNTASDSLLAIKKAVYDEHRLTPGVLLAALEANFEGYENVRRLLLAYPKFGNDHPEADAMSLWVNETFGRACLRQRETTGLDCFHMVMINNGDNVLRGKFTAATADGRKRGEPISNGNQPSAGCDGNGVTALLNSMSKLDPACHAGVTHNLKLSRGMFRQHAAQVDALLDAYFTTGGTQIMITVLDRLDLERALVRPEEYRNLIVRVGGYSERFIDLPRDIQMEVLRRTLY